MEIITHSSLETQNIAKDIGQKLKGGEILALVGGLGAGKTTFVQGLALGLGITQRIISPTFILVRRYQMYQRYQKPMYFYHVDLYRLEHDIEKEVINLGLPDILGKKDAIVVIEWAEKIKNILPNTAKWITFAVPNENTRGILIR